MRRHVAKALASVWVWAEPLAAPVVAAFRRFDRWLIRTYPDLWATRTHYVVASYPALFALAYLSAGAAAPRLGRIPQVDEQIPWVLMILAFAGVGWGIRVARLQGEFPLRAGVEGWTAPLRMGLGFALLSLLGYAYVLGVHARIESLVTEEEFLADNHVLRSIDFRAASGSAKSCAEGGCISRRLGLAIGEAPEAVALEEADRETLSEWAAVASKYSGLGPDRVLALAQQQAESATFAADFESASRGSFRNYGLWVAVRNLAIIGSHKGLTSEREQEAVETPLFWVTVALIAFYLGFVFDYIVALSMSVSALFWVRISALGGGYLLASMVYVAWLIEDARERVGGGWVLGELGLVHAIGLHLTLTESGTVLLGAYAMLLLPAFAFWWLRRQSDLRKGLLWLTGFLGPLAVVTVGFTVADAHSGAVLVEATGLGWAPLMAAAGAYLVVLRRSRVVLNNILAWPQ